MLQESRQPMQIVSLLVLVLTRFTRRWKLGTIRLEITILLTFIVITIVQTQERQLTMVRKPLLPILMEIQKLFHCSMLTWKPKPLSTAENSSLGVLITSSIRMRLTPSLEKWLSARNWKSPEPWQLQEALHQQTRMWNSMTRWSRRLILILSRSPIRILELSKLLSPCQQGWIPIRKWSLSKLLELWMERTSSHILMKEFSLMRITILMLSWLSQH